MKKPHALDCATEMIDGRLVRMFPIGKQELWPLGMATGKLADRRALKRCTVFIELKDRLRRGMESIASSSEELATDSKMSAMRFDDDEDEEESPVKKNRKRSREPDGEQTGRRARYFMDAPPTQVRVLEEASSKEEREVWLVARKGRLWIDEDNLVWIVLWVKAEL